MVCFADILFGREDFFGSRLPKDVCQGLLQSVQLLGTVKPASVIENITPSEFSVLCCAEYYPEKTGAAATVADIAAQMHVSVPAVSRTLRGLQQRGFIDRSVDESDRRSVRVTITQPGREILEQNLRRVVEKLDRIMSVFSEDEMRTIAGLYGKFAASMAVELGGNAGAFPEERSNQC